MESWIKRNGLALQLIGGLMATLITLTAYAFTTFQTKEESKETNLSVEKRLDRIENKLDILLRR